MIAIETKYLCPTNRRPARIVARTHRHRLVMSNDNALSREESHRKCAEALRDKAGLKGELICGDTREGYVFVLQEYIEESKRPYEWEVDGVGRFILYPKK